ncbi:MAG TPA: hypothetical protein VGL00_09860 [Terracidiphilus sp.]|jgi:hypothetical protein
MSWVEAHVAGSIELWDQCAGSVPNQTAQYAKPQQKTRENAYDRGIRDVEDELKTKPLTAAECAAQQDRLIANFGRFATTALSLEDDAVHTITHEFIPVGRELACWTRRFDPAMTKADILQACRNAWTACGLQPLLGRPTELTPSILAYSLMYPYSDNYIDRADIAPEAKSQFSARFRERLRGGLPLPLNEREAALWMLVELVEGEYPRDAYAQVYESLLAIHAAQERSIAQLKNGGRASDAEVLEISCQKGGTSVLADAFLAAGTLSEAEARFAFNWGVLLQLGDDLQDLGDDLRRQSATLFTRAVRRREPLDALVNRLLAFSDRIAAGMDELPHSTPMLRKLLPMSWRSLIVEAVADARPCFTRRFLRELELTSPFRLKFLRKRHRRLRRRRGMYESLFDTMVEARDDQTARVPLPNCRVQPTAGKPASAMAISSAG